MPTGWTQDGDRWKNDGVAAQSDAIDRGGAFHLNLDTKTLDICPWTDGSDDCLSMRPVLPDGVTLGPVVENSWGWKFPMSNGWKLWLLDMQGSKIPDALDDFLADGVAVVYANIPVAEVPLTGEWRAKQIRFLAGYEDYTFAIQPALTAQEIIDGASQPLWVPGSIAIYHNSKVNNRPGARYMTGKVAHLPRPLMVGWRNGEITGYAFGVYEDLGGGYFEKVFDMDAIIASGDLTMNGSPQTVSVSADLGYTDIGASNWQLGTIGRGHFNLEYEMPEAGILSSMSIELTGWTSTKDVGVYKKDGTDFVLVEEWHETGSKVGNLYTFSSGTSPALASGASFSFLAVAPNTQGTLYYDATGRVGHLFASGLTINPLDTPLDITSATSLDREVTSFITYVAGGGGGGTPDQSGLSIDLSIGL